MQIFMSGATGFFGSHLRKALLDKGHLLRVLVHNTSGEFEAGITTVSGDASRINTLASLVDGCDAIINLVGIIREFPSKGITFEQLHVNVTRNLLLAANQAGIRRFIQMSALGTRSDATSDYHRTKFTAEELVRNSGLDYTIFRPSMIFGPRDAFVNVLVGYIRNYPVVPVIGDGAYRLQPISADDVARCFAMALGMPGTIGQTYELCGRDRLSYNDLIDTIGRILGKSSVVKVHAPLALMKLIVPALERFPAFPLTMDQLLMLIEENICDGCWHNTFDFEPVPFREGISSYLCPSP